MEWQTASLALHQTRYATVSTPSKSTETEYALLPSRNSWNVIINITMMNFRISHICFSAIHSFVCSVVFIIIISILLITLYVLSKENSEMHMPTLIITLISGSPRTLAWKCSKCNQVRSHSSSQYRPERLLSRILAERSRPQGSL